MERVEGCIFNKEFPNAYKQGKTCQEQLYILLTNKKSCASDQEELDKT